MDMAAVTPAHLAMVSASVTQALLAWPVSTAMQQHAAVTARSALMDHVHATPISRGHHARHAARTIMYTRFAATAPAVLPVVATAPATTMASVPATLALAAQTALRGSPSSARALAFRKHRLDTFVTVASTGFAVEDGGPERPPDLAEPRHARVLEQVQPAAAVTGDGAPAFDVQLGALTVELRLSDVRAIREARRIGQALAKHRGNEASHSH